MTKVTPYYTLFVRSPETGEWEDVYGSYVAQDCKDQWLYNYNGYGEYTDGDCKMVKTDGSHEALIRVHRKLNPDTTEDDTTEYTWVVA